MTSAFRVLVAAGLLLVSACGTSSGGSSGSNYTGKTITIGAVLSLTGAGAVYGPSSKAGIELGVEMVNKRGGVSGAMLNLLPTEDDASDKSQSAQVAQKLVEQDHILALLGPTLSNSAVAVHPEMETLKTPVVAVSNTGT